MHWPKYYDREAHNLRLYEEEKKTKFYHMLQEAPILLKHARI